MSRLVKLGLELSSGAELPIDQRLPLIRIPSPGHLRLGLVPLPQSGMTAAHPIPQAKQTLPKSTASLARFVRRTEGLHTRERSALGTVERDHRPPLSLQAVRRLVELAGRLANEAAQLLADRCCNVRPYLGHAF